MYEIRSRAFGRLGNIAPDQDWWTRRRHRRASDRLETGGHRGPHLGAGISQRDEFARAGNPYLTPDGVDWPDNALRFAALARIAADIGLGVVPSFVPDIVHAHDWHAALALAYLHYSNRRRPATVMTVHNLAYQGVFPREMLAAIGLPPESFTIHGVEYYGNIGFLKAGLYFADRITTVSPTYAREILSDEGGMGLGGLLRERSCDLSGILNGVDTSVWDPATDPHIPGCFDADMPR